MTTETNPDNQTATVTYDSFTRMSSEKLFGATGTVSITPAQEAGLVARRAARRTLRVSGELCRHGYRRRRRDNVAHLDALSGVISETDGRGNTTDDHAKQPGLARPQSQIHSTAR